MHEPSDYVLAQRDGRVYQNCSSYQDSCHQSFFSVTIIVVKSDIKQGCQMAKFDPFLSLDCARVEGVGVQSKERKGSNFAV